jgi:hypothetical protein
MKKQLRYCNCDAGSDSVTQKHGEELLRRAGLEEIVDHIGQIDRAISEGHRYLRRNDRAETLGVNAGDYARRRAEREFAIARRHARRARAALGEARNAQLRELEEPARGEDVAEALAEAREWWIDGVFNADLSPEDAREIAGAWDEMAERLQRDGLPGVLDSLDDAFDQIEKRITQERDWGREPHSPLEWWQWLIVIMVVGLAIAFLLACLFWAGCAWIGLLLPVICAAAGPGAWFVIIICAGFTF